jgi:uncharacterized protein YcaQ
MPMPPPKPTSEGPRDRQVLHEVRQVARAVQEHGPLQPDDLATLVGAPFWEEGRFERALAYALADGLVVRGQDGVLQPSV